MLKWLDETQNTLGYSDGTRAVALDISEQDRTIISTCRAAPLADGVPMSDIIARGSADARRRVQRLQVVGALDPNNQIAAYEPPPPKPLTLADYRAAVSLHVDTVAQERNYDDGTKCASYVASTVPLWAAEAASFIAWRDAVWSQAVALMAAVGAGDAVPPAIADMIAALPAIVWPDAS